MIRRPLERSDNAVKLKTVRLRGVAPTRVTHGGPSQFVPTNGKPHKRQRLGVGSPKVEGLGLDGPCLLELETFRATAESRKRSLVANLVAHTAKFKLSAPDNFCPGCICWRLKFTGKLRELFKGVGIHRRWRPGATFGLRSREGLRSINDPD